MADDDYDYCAEGGDDDNRKVDGIDMIPQMRQSFSLQQDEIRRVIETIIAHHIHSLNITITQEILK